MGFIAGDGVVHDGQDLTIAHAHHNGSSGIAGEEVPGLWKSRGGNGPRRHRQDQTDSDRTGNTAQEYTPQCP
jgi:hypothetical protein